MRAGASCSTTVPAIITYQSIPDHEQKSLLSTDSSAVEPQPAEPIVGRRRLPSGSHHRRFLVVLAMVAVSLLLSLPHLIPSLQELELAHEYDLNAWTAAFRLRKAQSVADASIGFLASGGNINLGNVNHSFRKVTTRNGAKHYMEPPEGCEASLVLLRHCEKGHIREHCNYLGYERSVYLASLFGDDHERWPAPSFIFAEGPGQRRNKQKMNFREVETVGPLSKKIGVPVDDSYSVETANDLAKQYMTMLQTGQMCGKLTLIVWKHSDIGHLARHLGCGPSQGCPIDYKGRSFDDAWQIKYSYRTKQHSDHKDLSLDHKPEWNIYGGVQPEGFDPLAFSKQSGDYPYGGTDHGARWEKIKVDYPERTSKHATAGWTETRLGFDNSNDQLKPHQHKHQS